MLSPLPQRQGSGRPILFVLSTLSLCALWSWPRRWLISGAPFVQFFILLGRSKGYPILPTIHIWPLFTTINLLYAICSTSWLLYWGFTIMCYPAIFFVCLVQFDLVSNFVRRRLRAVLKELQFIDDRIAFFGLPALEIDTGVDGLLVLRGITFSLSTLSFVVHGVEVGIKLSDDMEMAIQCEEVTVNLFRSINVSECFANLKGGQYEMTFGKLKGGSHDVDGDAVFVEQTPLLNAASRDADTRSLDGGSHRPPVKPEVTANLDKSRHPAKIVEGMTNDKAPEDSTPQKSFESVKSLSPDNKEASGKYKKTLDFIQQTNAIREARKYMKSLNLKMDEESFDNDDSHGLRAAICSQLHQTPTVPHPPQKSIKVTTLQTLMPSHIRRFMHRLPLLYRFLLSPISYFHPVNIKSVTATASGKWIEYMLIESIFKGYSEGDSEIKGLKKHIATWLTDASFAVELAGITGVAQVPINTSYDIVAMLGFEDVMTYRTIPETVELKQVIRLGGADARFNIPSFLLPHHDHLLPSVPTQEKEEQLKEKVEGADGKPKELQAQHELKQTLEDEANVKISVHARLPACFDQELLNFIAALLKASKVVEFEKSTTESSATETETETETEDEDEEERKTNHGIKAIGKSISGMGTDVKRSVKKAVVGGVVNDRWIAKMVGKVTKRLETARGEAGYSGDIPVNLKVYRTGERERDGEKLLP